MNIDLTNLNTNLIYELTDYLTKPDSFNIYKDEFTCAYKAFFDLPGENHYHLLANISNQINNSTIIDLGTYRGSSALALSYNKTNKVHTFDIEYDCAGRHHTIYQDQQILTKENITSHIYNIFTENIDDSTKTLLLNSNIIFMDAGDHLSKKLESFLINFLRNNNYNGIVIWDDIFLNNDMIEIWNSIPSDEKINITSYGHYSGTGIWTLNKDILVKI